MLSTDVAYRFQCQNLMGMGMLVVVMVVMRDLCGCFRAVVVVGMIEMVAGGLVKAIP